MKKISYILYSVMNRLLIITLIAFILFIISFDFTMLNGYSLLLMLVLGIIFYFGFEHILKMVQNGRSMVAIIIFVIIMLIISAFGWAIFMVYSNKKQIDKQWPQYKCKPYVLPFAGTVVGPSNVSVGDNFINCLWNINKSFFDILMAPFVDMMKLIVGILSGLTTDIQNIRKMVVYMRESLEDLAKDISQKMWDAYYRIAYLLKVILKTFAKLGDVFKDLFDVLTYIFYTMASLWNGPIGKVSSFFCFDKLTPILMNNKTKKYISEIKVGEILDGNNGVIGVLKFSSQNVSMYYYHSIIVSGDHLVKENGKWIRVRDSVDSQQIDNYWQNNIYCLITENGTIKINNILFGDYNETIDQRMIDKIYNFILMQLNPNIIPFNYNQSLQSGLDRNVKIIMDNGDKKCIKNIKIGDIVKDGGEVIGLTKILPYNVYKYKNNIMTDNMIIYINNQWIPLNQLCETEKIKYDKCLYHLVTENNVINIDGLLIRDFEQLNEVNSIIDHYVEVMKN